jgi:hypothetical protein
MFWSGVASVFTRVNGYILVSWGTPPCSFVGTCRITVSRERMFYRKSLVMIGKHRSISAIFWPYVRRLSLIWGVRETSGSRDSEGVCHMKHRGWDSQFCREFSLHGCANVCVFYSNNGNFLSGPSVFWLYLWQIRVHSPYRQTSRCECISSWKRPSGPNVWRNKSEFSLPFEWSSSDCGGKVEGNTAVTFSLLAVKRSGRSQKYADVSSHLEVSFLRFYRKATEK